MAAGLSDKDWMEIRVQGKLPERRSNHASFIEHRRKDYLYIHGGRDLKEGALDNIWRLDLNGIKRLSEDDQQELEWEQVKTKGQGPGPISHHTCAVIDDTMVLIGGQVSDDDNDQIYGLNLDKLTWSVIPQKGDVPEPRDDHTMVQVSPNSYLVFGGFVNGSRRNDVYSFAFDGREVNWTLLAANTSDQKLAPAPRASHCAGFHAGTMYVIGGEDEDHNKLNDFWAFDLEAKSWKRLDCQGQEDFCRSGASASVSNGRIYIFGGILEITKELNDMYVFDCASQSITKHAQGEQKQEEQPSAHLSVKQATLAPAHKQQDGGASPSRRGQGGASPSRKPHQSPNRKSNKAPGHQSTVKKDREHEEEKVLTSPTSLQMVNSFIIKNADSSFDSYYHTMKKRKQAGLDGSMLNQSMNNQSRFGAVKGKMPTARDGHCSIIDKDGNMYVFGGDRHHMPFNDLYMIKLS